jgi:ABC-type transport system involved in cytochrome bd biosynthesis fused ATPase/permease subunit
MLLTLMSEFGNTKKIRDLVRGQVFAGARFTLALVLARYPSANLLAIANAVGDLETLYPKVLLPANIIVDKLEKDSKVPEERETPQG